jgi:hypothetical protein
MAPQSKVTGASRPQHNNRSEPRQKVRLRAGHIADWQSRLICACVIRDHSTKGARLLLPANVWTPDVVWFYETDIKDAVRAKVRWRRGQEIGILKCP